MGKHRVAVIGSGFGGLVATRRLKRSNIDVTMIASTAHHLFQPLLYQVATGILSEGEIAPATREVLRRQRNARVVQGTVDGIDVERREVHWTNNNLSGTTSYDTLIVAAGAGQSYFGNDHFATFAPGMKTVDDALELRARIFGAFELAELETDPRKRRALLTFAVVGAGPTGVEMAGQIRELSSHTLRGEFRRFDPAEARVLLIDGASQPLPAFGQRLGGKTTKALTKLGVELRLNTIVTDVTASGLELRAQDGTTEHIESVCKVWAAGVQASPLGQVIAEQTGAELDRSGRVRVASDLTVPHHPEVFVIGDLMAVEGVPGVAPAAIQSATFVADLVDGRVNGKANGDETFNYRDKGSMATIARFKAVVSMGPVQFSGFFAWFAWCFLHLLYIVGFKQRITTLMHWAISFLSRERAERTTTEQQLLGRLALEKLAEQSGGKLMAEEPFDLG